MAWEIEKVRPRLERRGRWKLALVRYHWSWFQSAYGAAVGTASTHRQARKRLWQAQTEMLADGH